MAFVNPPFHLPSPTNTNSQNMELHHTWKSAYFHYSLGNFTLITGIGVLMFTMPNKGITIITKKIEKYCSIKSNSCTPINP